MRSVASPHIVRRIARALLSVGLLVGPLAGASTASAAGGLTGSKPPASMTLNLTESPNPVASSGALTYTMTVSEPQVPVQVCEILDGLKPKLVCYWDTQSGPLSGIVVTDTLPSGVVFNSASATGGFSCAPNGSVVTCSNGSLVAAGSATITISATAPALAAGGGNVTLSDSASANPGGETASVLTTVTAPPALADLTVTSFSGSQSVARGGTATYTFTVVNIGQGAANGVNIEIDGGTSDFTVVSSTGSPGFGSNPQCYSAPERFSLAAFCPGLGWGPTLAPGGTLTATISVLVPSTYAGTWNFSATVNPFHNATESNYTNNGARLVTTTVY